MEANPLAGPSRISQRRAYSSSSRRRVPTRGFVERCSSSVRSSGDQSAKDRSCAMATPYAAGVFATMTYIFGLR